MDRQPQTPQDPAPRDPPLEPSPGPHPCPAPETPPGATLNIGPIFVQTVRHFFPDVNDWIDAIDDPRFLPFVTYHKRFLVWWGLSLFLFKLSSRRQLDFQLNSDGPAVLANLNRLADTNQETRPVNKTLDYFLLRIGTDPVAGLLTLAMRRLLRMKALDSARLQGRYLIAIDGSGCLVFRYRHCEHCLVQQHGEHTLYLHQVLEAKLLGPDGMVLSIATEFIDNRDWAEVEPGANADKRKQDCELKAYRRLLARLRGEFPQLRICVTGDSLFACGEGFQIAKDYHASFVYVFKEGRLPAVWADFQGLLSLCPEQRVQWITPAQVRQEYRWVDKVSYTDSAGRPWQFTAIQCEEIHKDGTKGRWAWVVSSDLKVDHDTVAEVSTTGGRQRWHIENQGFNTQKNSGLNLEHAYSHGPQWAAYYFLLQIAHMLLQLVEKGSLLRRLAAESGKRSALALFGSLKNIAQRLLESVRQLAWPASAYDAAAARRIQIRFDTS
jgi:hypothetical protein